MPARRVLLALATLASLTTGCRYLRPVDPNAEAPRPAAQPSTATARDAARPQSTGRLTDANIAAMVLALNNTDISYARLAPARAGRDDVRKFAERMLTDHTGVNQLVTNLLVKLDVAAEDNTASLDMRDESAEKRDLMRDLSGFAFDSTYAANEISYHRKFLSQLDNVMIPAARHPELRGLLTSVRPAVASHLAHAEQLWADVVAKK
jgi:putative membrane protein